MMPGEVGNLAKKCRSVMEPEVSLLSSNSLQAELDNADHTPRGPSL
jgi:hypothetical protein